MDSNQFKKAKNETTLTDNGDPNDSSQTTSDVTPSSEFDDPDGTEAIAQFDFLSPASLAEILFLQYLFKRRPEAIYVCNEKNYYEVVNSETIKKLLYSTLDTMVFNQIKPSKYDQIIEMLGVELKNYSSYEDDNAVALVSGLYDISEMSYISYTDDVFCNTFINIGTPISGIFPIGNKKDKVFDNFLSICCNKDQQTMELLRKFMAYCLIPRNPEKRFFVLSGSHKSCADILCTFIEHLRGSDSVSHLELHSFDDEKKIKAMVCKPVNISFSTSDKPLSPDAVNKLNMLVNSSPIDIHKKSGESFSFRCTAKMVFSTRQPIKVKKANDEFWDRMVLIPLPDCDLYKSGLDYLMENSKEIACHLMIIAHDRIKKGWKFDKYEDLNKVKYEWQRDPAASVRLFINKCCIIGDEDTKTHTGELYKRYKDFCVKNIIEPVTEYFFSKSVSIVLNRRSEKWEQANGYKGIKLKESMEENKH